MLPAVAGFKFKPPARNVMASLRLGEQKGAFCKGLVSASATAQHIEAPISTNNNLLDNQNVLYCQYRFFKVELRF